MKEEEQPREQLAKAYESKQVEARWCRYWEQAGYLKAEVGSNKPPFVISLPPPNVTGQLHMGHALGDTLQDVLIRWKRMSGYQVLWVPGTDHAGIATQTVVERHLMATQGKRRKEFPREEFVGHIVQWKKESEQRILQQIKRLGCSCDWSRLAFTMDDQRNKAVRVAFKRLFDRGLIYRGDYLVNWDPRTQTALADEEVEYEERQSSLWYIRYPFADGEGHLTIATTRPETMLGDVAVAISPRDERYAPLVGRKLLLPFVNRELPILADYQVDPNFGTGAVKITPAHDLNDYQMGLRHQLPLINILTADGKINENGLQFTGMTIEEARQAVVQGLEKLGLLEKVEPHLHRVGLSYRSKAVIEPFLSKQWFVRTSQFVPQLRNAITEGKVRLHPSHWESTYFHWIDHLRDWCISRQLWWGHRIPIWYHQDDPSQLLCYDGEGLPPQVEANPEKWQQDEDVLDTWFSASLWPLSILGWPEETPDLASFYPNSLLVTGYDILFFWVARMIMMGEFLTGQPPFSQVLLHGLIFAKSYWRKLPDGAIAYVKEEERVNYDLGKIKPPADVQSRWEKMSKTKGNVIDPLEIIDQYGADAMRMALCASASQGRQIDLDRRRFEEFKNFANKLWNGARFTLIYLQGQQEGRGLTAEQFLEGIDQKLLSLEDRWILSRLSETVASVNDQLERYSFDQAAHQSYDFFWRQFCAYYVEITKPHLMGKRGSEGERLNKLKLLAIVLGQAIRLIHPMAPFISEELFAQLKATLSLPADGLQRASSADSYTREAVEALQAPCCMMAPYPQLIDPHAHSASVDRSFGRLEQLVYLVRNLRGEIQIPPSEPVDLYVEADQSDLALLDEVAVHRSIIEALVKIGSLSIGTPPPRGFGASGRVEGLRLFVPLPAHLQSREKNRLQKEISRIDSSLEQLERRLKDEAFVARAPAEMVEEQRMQLDQLRKRRGELLVIIEQL